MRRPPPPSACVSSAPSACSSCSPPSASALPAALWLATATTFQPKTYFSVQWTAYMIFMVLVGGIGKFEGAILGAVLFFLIETWFGALGVWYLIGLGATAVMFSLLLPRGLWGEIERRFDLNCCRSATG